MQVIELNKILETGISIASSGTTGQPKTIFQSPGKIRFANKIALDVQKITKRSKILTVCKLDHAGGLLAQTLPATSIGAKVTIKKFNPFTFLKEVNRFTHTHLTPTQCKILMKTKSFKNFKFDKTIITCGSEPVTWDIIESFVHRNCILICNWGMTEIGPITILCTFNDPDEVSDLRKRAIDKMTIMGNKFYCNWKIIDHELVVKSDQCVYENWFNTGDLVSLNSHNELYYNKRKIDPSPISHFPSM